METSIGIIIILLVILPFALKLSDKYRNDY